MGETAAQRRWDSEEASARRGLTLPEILGQHAGERPRDTAFSFLPDGETIETELTFAELDGQARTIASHLADFEGQRAVLIYPSSAEFVAALFGCLYAGVVAVHAPLVASTPERTLSRLEVVAGNSDASLVLSPREVTERQALFVAPDSPLRALPWYSSDVLAADPSRLGNAPLAEPRLDRLALIQYTSGTTGTARGVPLRHAHLTAQTCALQCAVDSDHRSITVGWTPLFHDMGLFVSVLGPVYTGHRSVVIFPLAFLARPARWLEAMTRFRGTISGGPNFAYELTARGLTAELVDRLDLAAWRVAFIGGEQVRPATLARFAGALGSAGFDPRAYHPSYGLAEATCAVSGRSGFIGPGVRSFDRAELRRGRAVETAAGQDLASAGSPHGDQRCVIVDPRSGAPLPDGVIGELWIAGSGVADGYWNEPDATGEAFGGRIAGTDDRPFLRTGDLAFTVDGELFMVGRLKELIIVRGRNVYPQDVEATVQASHPALRPGGGAAFALDGDDGEVLIVAHELRAGAGADPETIKQAIRGAVMADHEIEIHAIVLLPPRSLPKTTSGKVQRGLCRTHFLSGVWPVPRAG